MELIGIIGYLFASAAYLVFMLLLLAVKNKTLPGKIIFISSLWVLCSAIAATAHIHFSLSLKYVLAFENIKLITWIFLLLATRLNTISFTTLLGNNTTRKALLALGSISVFCWYAAHTSSSGSKYLFLLFLVLNLAAIVSFEQLYRNAEARAKWALWPLVISLGTATVFDFVIFAQATMIERLDFDFWYSRGFIIALGMPFFLISTKRMKNWSVEVFISREVVFYSSMLLIAGVYLLILALAGYAINFLGGQWGDIISIAFLVLGGTVLAALLITEKLRREVKVFIAKHFFANKYDYRVEWLKSIEQLAIADKQDYYKTATEIICSSIQAKKGALIKKLSAGKYKCVYDSNFNFDGLIADKVRHIDSFCQTKGWIIDVREFIYVENSYPDLALDTDFCKEYEIDLIVPIHSGNEIYGLFLLSLGNENSGYVNWEDRDLLFAITKQLSNYLSLNEATKELSESKQFEAFHRMSAFLVHDLKNIQAQLGLINSNAKRHRDNPAFIDDVFDTIESATSRLDKVLTQLRNKQVTEKTTQQTAVCKLIKKVAEQRNIAAPKVMTEIDSNVVANVDEEFYSVLNHLVQNAQEATDDSGWVRITASQDAQELHVAVLDCGSGMSVDFIEQRLFKPFDTTKGNAGMGIGAYEAKQYVEGLGGSIKVTSFENEGSIFHVTLPCD